MATKKQKEKKTNNICIRLTDTEHERLLADMESINCKSVSKYVRLRLFSKYATVRKEVITDEGFRKLINQISLKYSKVGNNYNQVVKRVNELTHKTNKENRLSTISTSATI